MSEYLKITRDGQMLEIVLDRPKANTLDGPLSREMGRVFAEFRDDPDLRVAKVRERKVADFASRVLRLEVLGGFAK